MEKDDSSKFHAWRMLFYLFLIQLSIAFVGRSIAPLGAIIGDDLGLTMLQIGLFPAALFLGQSLISIPAGFLSDKIGSKRALVIIALTLSVSFYVISLVTSFLIIFILIIFAGFSYGASHPATNRGVNYWFDKKSRGTAMGIKQMGITLGSASAALLLLPLAVQFNWQTALVIASSFLLIVGLIFYFRYYESLKSIQVEEEKVQFSTFTLFAHKKLMMITISAMLLSGSQAILNTFIVLYAYNALGISLVLSGVLLGIAEFGGALGRIGWGWLSDKVFSGQRITILLIISLLVAVQSLITSLLPEGISFYIVAVVIFIFGLGASGFNGIWMNATSETVPPSYSGRATGISITISSWGAILFPPLFGVIIDWSDSYSLGWLLIIILMVLSVFTLARVDKNKN